MRFHTARVQTRMARAGAAAVILLLGLAMPGAAGAAPATWSGTWQTEWTGGSNGNAEMVLAQTGNTVSGTYNHKSGTIEGTVTADRLDGTWTQGSDGGTFSFTLGADGKTWAGTWTGGDGGSWSGTCTGGDCLAATAAPTPIPTVAATTAKRPSATVVQCDRDTNTTTNAHFECRALVNDVGVPAQGQKPTGVVTWTAKVGSFLSGASCTLDVPDVGASSCVVAYDAQSSDAPIGTALPVTASYGGDSLFSPSSGTHRLFPGPATSDGGGIPGWAVAAAATGVVAVAGIGIGVFLHGRAATDGVSSLVDGGIGMEMAPMFEQLGIDPAQFDAAAAAMSPEEQRQVLAGLDQAFAAAHGQLPAATHEMFGGTPATSPPSPPADPAAGGGGSVIGTSAMGPYTPTLIGRLGLDSQQLTAAFGQLSPADAQHALQNLHAAFSKAGGAR